MRSLKYITLLMVVLIFAAHSVISGDAPVEHVLASHSFSLEKRYDDPSTNGVFKDNILLTLAYMNNQVHQNETIDWQRVKDAHYFEFILSQGQTFAFHDEIASPYKGRVIKTTNAHFNSDEGFISDGYLIGDGVCHLASLLYWTAKEAGLETSAPTNHDFANIPEVPREYGVSIFAQKGASGEVQNLYITNNRNSSVIFKFDFDGHNLKITAEEVDK